MPKVYKLKAKKDNPQQLKIKVTQLDSQPTYGKLFFHIKKQNIHKYILKESVVSNPICQVLDLATSLLKKKMIHPVFANECERKKKNLFLYTPYVQTSSVQQDKNKQQMWQLSTQLLS